jgi:serine protease Do
LLLNFLAVAKFQSENGFAPTRNFNRSQLDRLLSLAKPNLVMWGFRKVSHPFRNHAIWVPVGLGLVATQTPTSLELKDGNAHVQVDFNSFQNSAIAPSYAALVQALQNANDTIHYKILKDGWFAISSTTPGGIDGYDRYHQDGTNATGFSVEWDNSKGDIHGDRMATLMSASLWADMTGAPFFDLNAGSPPPSGGPPSASQPAAAGSAPAPTPAPTTFSTGTGFFVDGSGAFVTAEHVVDGCSDIAIKTAHGTISQARILGLDKTNDLALLMADKTSSPKYVSVRTGIRLGEGVEAFGFPHSDILASSGNFTIGNVTALSGMGDDLRFLQISAPVQAGNSGGPLLDQSGNLVGVVDAKLDALKLASADGDLPQNVNFALKADMMITFLQSNGVTPPAWFACEVMSEHPAGDHVLVLGKVINGDLLDSKAEPMLYRETGSMDGASALYPASWGSHTPKPRKWHLRRRLRRFGTKFSCQSDTQLTDLPSI